MMSPKLKLIILAGCAALALGACETDGYVSDGGNAAAPPPPPPPPPPAPVAEMGYLKASAPLARVSAEPMPQVAPHEIEDREQYEDFEENPVKSVADEPVSTFSIDVDTASYAVVRRDLNYGTLPRKDAVRIEELINYFDYTYPVPEASDPPFTTNVTLVPSPWSDGNMLMQVGLKGYEIEPDERPPINLTLLIDVSGSMGSEDKLPLAKKALKLLIDQMDEDDTISIAVYAGAAGTVLEPTKGSEKGKIFAALDQLNAGGSTAGGEGLRLAYNLAEQNFDKDAVNRVMLLTDGDFNVGITNPEQLEDFVSRKRETGIYLSVMGFGRGNYNDAMMQKIAQTGNGTAGYVDTLNEARKLLSDDLSGSLFTIAKDVKIQVEFNPARVAEYRLIGYETRLLNEADFNNDKVDAGEIGAGHTVTAIYEITPVGADSALIDEHRYEANRPATGLGTDKEWAFLKLRYKLPDSDTSKLITVPVTDAYAYDDIMKAPQYTRFATAVAAYGQLLKGGDFLQGDYGYKDVIELAQTARGDDPFGYRAEFIQLSRAADTAATQAALELPTQPER